MFSIMKQKQPYEVLLTKFDVFLKLNQLFLFAPFLNFIQPPNYLFSTIIAPLKISQSEIFVFVKITSMMLFGTSVNHI